MKTITLTVPNSKKLIDVFKLFPKCEIWQVATIFYIDVPCIGGFIKTQFSEN